MKRLLLLLIVLLSFQFANAQDHSIGLFYEDTFGGKVFENSKQYGYTSYSYQRGFRFGFEHLIQLSSNLKLNTGVNFHNNTIEAKMYWPFSRTEVRHHEVKTLNFPVLLNVTFLKFLFLEGGPSLNIQVNEKHEYGIENQTGFAFLFGLGAKFSIDNLSFFVKNQNQIQALIPFISEEEHSRLLTSGISFGLHYRL